VALTGGAVLVTDREMRGYAGMGVGLVRKWCRGRGG
jgi:hypothetical protein